MINPSKIKCVGCTACASICPQGIIALERNNEGFYEPVVDPLGCVECGLCERACPVLNPKEQISTVQTGLIAQIKDETIRKESTSGGMFSAIALSVLEEGGIVYGAAYDTRFQVCHMGIDNKEDLWKLRHSKYVQSKLYGVFPEVKQYLDAGRKVCFSGTPCQIEGLLGYLQKDYENLLLVDIVCHGVSSPLIWDKYLEQIHCYGPKKIYFRWKHYGYKYSTMSVFDENDQEIYYAGVESDDMLRAYFSNNCNMAACYDCVFKKRYRDSDFTIWDCFQPGFFSKAFDDDRGTTSVLVHSEKGLHQLNIIIDAGLIKHQTVPVEKLIQGNRELVRSVEKGSQREQLLKDAKNMPPAVLFGKYFPRSFMIRIKKTARLTLIKIGLYGAFKYGLFLIRRIKSKRE